LREAALASGIDVVVDDEVVIGGGFALDLTLHCLGLGKILRVSYQRLLRGRCMIGDNGLRCA